MPQHSETINQSGRRFPVIRSSNYDLSNTCNLTCNGCYYFVSGQPTKNKRPSPEAYNEFFRLEAARGVNFPAFVGGEPSLNPMALLQAAKHFSAGAIYTNGTRKLPTSLPFRILISIWGEESINDRLRGAGSYRAAFQAAIGDPRALMFMTLTGESYRDILAVARDCAHFGLKLSFNDFSPTIEYMRLLRAADLSSNPFVRKGTPDQSLVMTNDQRRHAADLIDRAMLDFPQTVVYSRLMNDFVHRQEHLYEIDPSTGIATDCGYLQDRWHRGFDYELKLLGGKACGVPEMDCSECRVGPAATLTLLARLASNRRSDPRARQSVREVREYLTSLFFWDRTVATKSPSAA